MLVAIGAAFVLVLAGGTPASIDHAAAAARGSATTAWATPGSAGSSKSPNQNGRDFYVSPSGSDDNPGTSPNAPWKTLAKVDAAPLLPGDRVHLEGGAVFTEPLAPFAGMAGTSEAPIIFDSYGSEQATLAASIYLNTVSHLVFEDLNVSSATGKGVFSSASGDGAKAITLRNLTISDVPLTGITSDNRKDDGWLIENVTISRTGDSGIFFKGSNFLIGDATIVDTGTDHSIGYLRHGIYAAGPNATIVDNTITRFSTSGISLRYENALVENNRISDGVKGISFDDESTAVGTTKILYNTVSAVSDAGIAVAAPASENFLVADNTIVGARNYGIYVQVVPRLVIANNIVQATAATANLLNIRPPSSGYSEHHNLWYGGSSSPFYWNGTARTFTTYQSLSAQGASDLLLDPALDAELVPSPRSPAIDSGATIVDASLTYSAECDGQSFHYCGAAPDLGSRELPTPTIVAAPVLSGSTGEGGMITTSSGSWAGSPASYAYSWERCAVADGSCETISGADRSNYTLASADVGSTVRAIVTASNTFGTTAARTEVSPVISSAPYFSAVLASGPLGYWRLHEPAGSVATDSSGNARQGRYSATGVTYGVAGALSDADPAVSFASGAGFVDLGDTLDFARTESFTLEAWVRPSSLDMGQHRIVAKEGPIARHGYFLSASSGGVGFTRTNRTGTDRTFCKKRLPRNRFSHLVAAYDGATMRIYVDGRRCSATASTRPLANNRGSLRIGRGGSSNTSDSFDGSIDEVAVYSFALDAGAVAEHYGAR